MTCPPTLASPPGSCIFLSVQVHLCTIRPASLSSSFLTFCFSLSLFFLSYWVVYLPVEVRRQRQPQREHRVMVQMVQMVQLSPAGTSSFAWPCLSCSLLAFNPPLWVCPQCTASKFSAVVQVLPSLHLKRKEEILIIMGWIYPVGRLSVLLKPHLLSRYKPKH